MRSEDEVQREREIAVAEAAAIVAAVTAIISDTDHSTATTATTAAIAATAAVIAITSKTTGAYDPWWRAPKVIDSNPFWVDFRFNIFKVTDVNTVAGTAYVNFGIVCYWNDSRMVGWPDDKELPPSLWGPHIMLKNAHSLEEVESSFDLVDPTSGRMKRGREFRGTIDILMDLRAFPFDIGTIDLNFYSSSHWLTLNGKRQGSAPKGQTYRLRRIEREGEGEWLNIVKWDCDIPEWKLHGISTKIEEQSANPQGQVHTDVPLVFHVTRKTSFYFWKCLFPLYLLSGLTLSTFHFETDDLSGRNSTVSTYFLAAYAMLYVVAASLPKTAYLTKIDYIIVLTTTYVTFIGLFSLIVIEVNAQLGMDIANRLNFSVELIIPVLYILINLCILVPPYLNMRKVCKKYKKAEEKGWEGGDLALVQLSCSYESIDKDSKLHQCERRVV